MRRALTAGTGEKTLSVRLRVVLALTLLLILPLLAPAAAQQNAFVERVLEVNPYGLVYISDTVPRTGEVTAISFPSNLVKYLVNYRSPEDPNPTLEVEEKTFSIKVRSSSGDVIHLVTIFRDVVSRTPEGAFTFSLPLNPITSEKAGKFSLRVILPSDAEVDDYSPNFLKVEGEKTNVLEGISEGIDTSSETPEDLTISFRSRTLRLLDILRAELEVKYPERVADFAFKFRNGGGRDLDYLKIFIPPGSELIETRDLLGEIGNTYKAEKGELSITLRRSVRQGESETVEAVFKIPEGSGLLEGSNGALRIGLLLPMNMTIRVYEVRVIMSSVDFISSTPEPEELQRLYPERIQLSYTFDHIDPFNAGELEVKLNYKPIPSRFALMPYLWGAVLAAVVFGSVASVYVRKRAGAAVKETEKPLFDLVSEADAISAACQRVADLISTRRILDKGYIRPRILELRSSIRRHAGRIASLAGEVAKLKPDLSERVKELADSAHSIESDVESLWIATHNYLTGSMGRSAFRRLAEQHYKRIGAAHRRLSEALEYLRGRL